MLRDMTAPADLLQNQAFSSRFTVTSLLGQGGFANVYLGTQHSTGQRVAIKVLRGFASLPESDQERVLARFQREMRICSQLVHPHIVRLLDAAAPQEGAPYLIFEHIPGSTLHQLLLEQGPMAPRDASRLMSQVLDALACAHGASVLHRDLKPQNIMITRTGARTNAHVLDFGIGELMQESLLGDEVRLTASMEILGTPAYCSPEQASGLPATRASDLYSWGLVFLECLTGSAVARGKNVIQLLRFHVDQEPIALPGWLEQHPLGELLGRVLEKDAALRADDAAGLLAELEGHDLEGLGPQPDGERRGHPVRRDSGARSNRGVQSRSGGSRREKRAATLVCCQLEQSAAEESIEETVAGQDLVHALIQELAARSGGEILGSQDERSIVAFGAINAREDEQRHAARFALALLAKVEEERRSGLISSTLRVGMHTGLVVSRTGDDLTTSVAGPVVAEAGRLARVAPQGQIVVDAELARSLRPHFRLDRYPGGGDLDKEMYRLVSEHEAPLGRGSREGGRTPLVGRQHELGLLRERWERAAQGHGQAVLILGEPGIGKSRLIEELRTGLGGRSMDVLELRCSPEAQGSSLRSLLDALQRIMATEGWEQEDARREQISSFLSQHGLDLDRHLPHVAAAFGCPVPSDSTLELLPQQRRERLLESMLAVLFALTDSSPLLFLAEDLHWADQATLELLGRFLRDVEGAPVLAVWTCRSTDLPFSADHLLRLQLARLGPEDGRQLVEGMVDSGVLSRETLDLLLARADGVPLFLEELAWMAVARGEGTTAARGRSSAIPSTLRDLLASRLERVGGARLTAQNASVLGREFGADLLTAISDLAQPALEADLEALVSAGLLLRRRQARELHYQFRHALIRDAAYESMHDEQRRSAHARVARAIETSLPELSRSRPDLLAHHHRGAGQNLQAVSYAMAAAGSALQRSENGEARRQVEAALGWLKDLDDPATRIDLELQLNALLAPAIIATLGYGASELEALVQRSSMLLELRSDGPLVFPTLWLLGSYHHVRGHRVITAGIGSRALRIARGHADSGEILAALALTASGDFHAGRFAPARRGFEEALSLYDPALHVELSHRFGQDFRVLHQCNLALTLWFQGEVDGAVRAAESSLAWARTLRQANSIGMALTFLAGVHHYRRDRERCAETLAELQRTAEAYGMQMWGIAGPLLSAWLAGEPGPAPMIFGMMEAMGVGQAFSYWASVVAESELAAGQHEAALARLEGCARQALDSEEPYYLAEVHRLRGVALRELGRQDEARAAFAEALSTSRGQGARWVELRALLALHELSPDPELLSQIRAVVSGLREGSELPDLVEARARSDL